MKPRQIRRAPAVRRWMSIAGALLLAGIKAPEAPAQPSRTARAIPFIVSPAWVAERLELVSQPVEAGFSRPVVRLKADATSVAKPLLGNTPLVLLHVGDKAEYEGTHIPGAQFISVADIGVERDGLALELPPVEKLEAEFEKRGVSDSSLIILYFGRDWVSPTTRVFLTLDYLGLGDRTAILDGGLPAWRAEGHPITATIAPATPGALTPRVRPEVIADLAFVKANLHTPSVAILDARTPTFYTGEDDGRGRYARPGHIAGAASLPFNTVVTEDNRFKDAATLNALFVAAGVELGDRVVSYCHIGQQASVIYFVARYLGYDAKLYDGSFTEWSPRADLPVEKGVKR